MEKITFSVMSGLKHRRKLHFEVKGVEKVKANQTKLLTDMAKSFYLKNRANDEKEMGRDKFSRERTLLRVLKHFLQGSPRHLFSSAFHSKR